MGKLPDPLPAKPSVIVPTRALNEYILIVLFLLLLKKGRFLYRQTPLFIEGSLCFVARSGLLAYRNCVGFGEKN